MPLARVIAVVVMDTRARRFFRARELYGLIAVSRAGDGYAGLFDPAENRIEVAYWADHQLVIHEAAHGWFNGALLADRWANEGFASLYAERAAAAIAGSNSR